MPRSSSSRDRRLGAYALARERRAATLQAARAALQKAASSMAFEGPADFREKVTPVFSALFDRMCQMGAACAVEVWNAYIIDEPARLYVPDQPGRAGDLVRAAARFVQTDGTGADMAVGELQRQLQLAYDKAKAVCFDGQAQ